MLFINPKLKANKDLPNLALAYAATILNVKVIDLNTKSELAQRYLDKETDVLGISIQSRAYNQAKKIKEFYQNKYPSAQVKSIQTPIDIQCCYPYLDFKDKIIVEKDFSDNLPFPNYELFDSFEIFKTNWQKGKWLYPILTSLGCPYQCIYCMARNRAWKSRTAQNCFKELKQAHKKYNIKSFQIIDDCFSLDKKRVLEFCELIKPLKLKWFCTNGLRADLFDKEIAQAMSEAGCKQMSFGVETIDPELLIKIKKGEKVDQIEKAIKIAKKYFKTLTLFFIIGLPGSTYQKDLNNFHWVIKNKVRAHFSYFVPLAQDKTASQSFYGRETEPASDVYDKKLQKRIYIMTGYMRGGIKTLEILKNVLKSFVFIFVFDFKNIFPHLSNFIRIVFNKLRV